MTEGEPYQRDEKGKYNPNFVSKLINSFRSHPSILEVPNDCFYDGELRAMANQAKREMFCNWEVRTLSPQQRLHYDVRSAVRRLYCGVTSTL